MRRKRTNGMRRVQKRVEKFFTFFAHGSRTPAVTASQRHIRANRFTKTCAQRSKPCACRARVSYSNKLSRRERVVRIRGVHALITSKDCPRPTRCHALCGPGSISVQLLTLRGPVPFLPPPKPALGLSAPPCARVTRIALAVDIPSSLAHLVHARQGARSSPDRPTRYAATSVKARAC